MQLVDLLMSMFFNLMYFEYVVHSNHCVEEFTPFSSIHFTQSLRWCVMELIL